MDYVHPMAAVGHSRMLSRGGGPGVDFMLVEAYTCNWCMSCEHFCSYLVGGGTMDGVAGSTAYYGKCFNDSVGVPVNGKRFAFPSHLGTVGVDPALPTINSVNKTQCLRMSLK